jgi:hypothetical protein
MIRRISIAGTALLLVLAACSDSDDDPPAQATNSNQPGGGSAGSANNAAAQPGNANAATGASGAGNAGPADEEGPDMDLDLAGGGGAASDGAGAMVGAGGGMGMGAGGTGMMGAGDEMSFFVTSEGSGANGGNLGGLDGADAMCQGLAEAVGAGDKTWRAYLSTDTDDARDRIGSGPWFNQAGVLIAESIADLHAADTVFNGAPNLILDENGQNAPGPQHDILTGSEADGTAAAGLNCANWTSNSADLTENPRVGHSDIPEDFSPSWNAAHASANCSQAGLTQRGGAGRLYCFAED